MSGWINGRILSVLGLVVVSGVVRAQETVTYSTPALSLSDICRDLSEFLDGEFQVSGRLGELPVVIDVKEMPREAFLNSLAKAVAGEWRQNGETWTLSRSRQVENQLASASRAALTERIKELIRVRLEAYRSSTWDDSSLEKTVADEIKRRNELIQGIAKMNEGLPAGQQIEIMDSQSADKSASKIVLEEFLKRVNPSLLAQIAPGSRVVFADRPNAVQRPLPMNLSSAVARYLDVWQRIQRLSASYTTPENVRFGGGGEIGQPAPTGFAKILVAVGRQSDGEGFTIELKMLSSDGRIASQAMEYLGEEVVLAGSTVGVSEPAGDGPAFEVSGPEGELLTALKALPGMGSGLRESNVIAMRTGVMALTLSSGTTTTRPVVPEHVRAMAMAPGEYEPLSSFVSVALKGLAGTKGADLIAVPGDELFGSMARRLKPGSNSVSAVERILADDYVVSVEGGLMTVVPKDRLLTEAGSISRSRYSTVAKLVVQRGYGRLQDRLDVLNLKNSAPASDDLAILLLQVIDPGFANSVINSGNQFAENRFLASLPPQARADDGEAFSQVIGNLSPESKGWLERAIFGRSYGPIVIGRGTAIAMRMESDSTPMPPMPADVTEAYPNGIPAGAGVLVEKSAEAGVLGEARGKTSEFYTASALGMMRGLAERVPQFAGNAQFETYRSGRVLALTLSLQMETKEELSQESDFVLSADARPLAWGELSAEFRRAVDEAMRNAPQVSFGGGGVIRPPVR